MRDGWVACVLVAQAISASVVVDVKNKGLRCEQPCVNGECRNATCHCRAGWGGGACDRCAGRVRLTAERGFITDGPHNYSDEMRCVWLIERPRGLHNRSVVLQLNEFATECSWDHLFVYSGDSVFDRQIAAFSGVLRDGRTLVTQSSSALLYFYTDLALNMSGFNVSYSYSACASDCGGASRGECNASTGSCDCRAGWSGDHCRISVCTAGVNCRNNATCDSDGRCSCLQSFHGDRCDVSKRLAVWDLMPSAGSQPRASHAVALYQDSVWSFGGIQFDDSPSSLLLMYNLSTGGEWREVVPALSGPQPTGRYDHSLVSHGDALFVFGGVLGGGNVTAELWRLDARRLQWTALPDAPVAVAGHTAHALDRAMVVIFGYSPTYGFVNTVQYYFFGNSSWHQVDVAGAEPIGTFGHTSVYDAASRCIYVYGGYYGNGHLSGAILDRLYKFCPFVGVGTWTKMDSSGHYVFRHAAAILNGVMLIAGGNAHNESTSERITECFSRRVYAYDIECDTWYAVDERGLPPDHSLARTGHAMFSFNERVYAFGGFNGQMLGDMLRLTPGSCANRQPEDCEQTAEGAKCVWNATRHVCADVTNYGCWRPSPFDKSHEKVAPSMLSSHRCCAAARRHKMGCEDAPNCAVCLSSTSVDGCVWCDDRCTSECKNDALATRHVPNCALATLTRACRTRFTCAACRQVVGCRWDVMHSPIGKCVASAAAEEGCGGADGGTCVDAAAVTDAPPVVAKKPTGALSTAEAVDVLGACPASCAALADCADCLGHGCMWCSTLSRCVHVNAYLSSFPFGMCTDWVSGDQRCQDSGRCEDQLTCAQCQRLSPRCGWCDDGSGTGLGECVPGGVRGPLDALLVGNNVTECPADRWFYFDCPACQCNGHGLCNNGTTAASIGGRLKCEGCGDLTTGAHCDVCVANYYGNALNGGNCTKCECNKQADDCDAHTGECFCFTKGVSGSHCDKCDQKYFGDPKNGTCYYQLAVDFIFTFRLDIENPKDRYIKKINFLTIPTKKNTDVSFKLSCSGSSALVDLSVYSAAFEKKHKSTVRTFFRDTACTEIERRFSDSDFPFGTSDNTTFFVHLHHFTTPVDIQISFAQNPPIDWFRFLVTFAGCFVLLLVVAAAVWYVKLRFDGYRRRQRMFVEMAQMASRPFGCVQLELSAPYDKLPPSPVSVEPCANYRAAVVTVVVRMPTGGGEFAPSGQSGLAVASTICQLTPAQVALLHTPPASTPQHKAKRRQQAGCFAVRQPAAQVAAAVASTQF